MPDEDQRETGDPKPRVTLIEQAVIDYYRLALRSGKPRIDLVCRIIGCGGPSFTPASRADPIGSGLVPAALPSSHITSPASHSVRPELALASRGREWLQSWLVRASPGGPGGGRPGMLKGFVLVMAIAGSFIGGQLLGLVPSTAMLPLLAVILVISPVKV